MSFVLIFRPEVREELNEAYNWYESQQTGLGDDFIECVDEMLNRIRQMPDQSTHPMLRQAFDACGFMRGDGLVVEKTLSTGRAGEGPVKRRVCFQCRGVRA